jgi:RHS repeat-associated protein
MQTNYTSTTTYFVGNYYEITGGVVTKYYYAGSQRIAMRKDGTLNFILGDHLGSTSLITNSSGNVISDVKYKTWGEVRYENGNNPIEYTYTGQYSYADDFGLMYYGARWYDNSLGRFAQADTLVPTIQGIQGYDRYAYANNNSMKYTDPTGHFTCSTNRNSDDYCPGRTSPIANNSGNNSSNTITPSDPFYVSPDDLNAATNAGLQASINRGMEFVNNLRNHHGWWTPYIQNRSFRDTWKFILALTYTLEGYSYNNPDFLSYLTESIINKAGEFYMDYGVAGLYAYVGGREALFDRNVAQNDPSWEKGTAEYLNTWGFDPSDPNPYLIPAQRLLNNAMIPNGIIDQALPNVLNYSPIANSSAGTYGNGGYDYGISPPLTIDQSKLIWSQKIDGINPWTGEDGSYFIYVIKK